MIYSAGVAMSWREFRFNLRPITLLAFGCVLFTSAARGSGGAFCPWHELGVGFVLGAIVSPTDAVAPLAIIRSLGLPRRLLVVLDAEGLANDATALILYRFAVAAVATGMFSLPHAAGEFALIVVGEIAFGIGIGWVSLRLRRWARDPRVEITLSLMTPYVALPGSAASRRIGRAGDGGGRPVRELERPAAYSGGDAAAGHLLLGLDRLLPRRLHFPGDRHGDAGRCSIVPNAVSLHELGVALLLTVAVIVVARFIWVFPAAYLPRWLSPSLRRRDPLPPWQWTFLLAFVGVRGVVSLAAALAHAVDHRCRRAVSRPRSHSVCHLRRHRGHADRPGAAAAGGGALARLAARRRRRAPARAATPRLPRGSRP